MKNDELTGQLKIARMGAEGGGSTVYGKHTDGVWVFWREGTSMAFDDNDDEITRHWSTDPTPNLLDALPNRWWRLYTTYVHPDFVAQLRQAFEQYRDQPGWDASRFDPTFRRS